IYKTVEDVCDGIVNGPVYHATFKIPFGGFVKIDPIGCEKVTECDKAEVLEAFVEGEKDFLHGESTCKGVTVFNELLEKDVVKIVVKVVRLEHIPVACDGDEKDDDKCERCDGDKYEKICEDKKEGRCEEKEDGKGDKRYDCRGDYYAKCRGFYGK
ncbi:MAG TPA: hypothetical protein DD738_12795, partial [Ruminiclostridium sp.]|nr:hypothetical protein [Ruminiclostridium sp.]